MTALLLVALVVVTFHRRLFDSAVHALNLSIGPRMVRFGQAMFDIVGFANHVEPHRPRIDGIPVSRLFCKLDAVVCQDRVDLVRHGFQKELKEFPGCLAISLLNQLCDGELAGAVNTHKEKELAHFGSDLGNIDVKEADRVAFELLTFWLVTFDIRQA